MILHSWCGCFNVCPAPRTKSLDMWMIQWLYNVYLMNYRVEQKWFIWPPVGEDTTKQRCYWRQSCSCYNPYSGTKTISIFFVRQDNIWFKLQCRCYYYKLYPEQTYFEVIVFAFDYKQLFFIFQDKPIYNLAALRNLINSVKPAKKKDGIIIIG